MLRPFMIGRYVLYLNQFLIHFQLLCFLNRFSLPNLHIFVFSLFFLCRFRFHLLGLATTIFVLPLLPILQQRVAMGAYGDGGCDV